MTGLRPGSAGTGINPGSQGSGVTVGGGGGGGPEVVGSFVNFRSIASVSDKQVPAETLTGDLVLMFLMGRAGAFNPAPAGWRFYAGPDSWNGVMGTTVYGRIATADGNVAENRPTSLDSSSGTFWVIITVRGAALIEESVAISHSTGYAPLSGTVMGMPPVTVTGDALLLSFVAISDDTIGVPSHNDGFTLVNYISSTSGADGTVAVFAKSINGGTTAAREATFGDFTGDAYSGGHIALV